jgi:hypothetical protein
MATRMRPRKTRPRRPSIKLIMLSFEPSESAGMSDRVTRLRIEVIVNRSKVECYVGTATSFEFVTTLGAPCTKRTNVGSINVPGRRYRQ